MRNFHRMALSTATALLLSASMASAANNHTVVLSIPVDISAEPDMAGFTIGCYLVYPPGIYTTVFNRQDPKLVAGAFHGNVDIVMTAPDGSAPTGYRCSLYLTPPGSQSVKPQPADVAPGSKLVTEITGTFPVQFLRSRDFVPH